MLVNASGRFLTQRELPRMALIQPQVIDNETLTVTAPCMPELSIIPSDTGSRRQVVIWKDSCVAVDQGDDIADWFSSFLGSACRLVCLPEDTVRRVNPHYAVREQDQVGFADGYPFLLISEASLADLNSRMPEPLPMNRFRPNIVVSGTYPYDEDTWRTIRIREVTFHIVKPCARCEIPTTDQATAARGKEPLRTLATYRHAATGAMFGQNLIHIQQGVIDVGDRVEVLEKAAKPNFTVRKQRAD